MKMQKIKQISLVIVATILLGGAVYAKSNKAATPVDDTIWANGLLYGTVLTTNSFKSPPSHTVDILYNFMMSGLDGQRPVSDAAPGDKHYNGGRWWVHMVVFTELGELLHDPDGDGIVNFELTTSDMVLHHESLGHIEIIPTSHYFSCPLRGPGVMPME